MTKNEMMGLASEAGLWVTSVERLKAIEKFTELVEAAEREAIEQRIHKLDITLHTRLYVINHAIRSLTKEAEKNGEEL